MDDQSNVSCSIQESSNLDPNTEYRILKLFKMDHLFRASEGMIINNEVSLLSKSLTDEMAEAIFSTSDGEIGFVSSCECGQYTGNYYEGVTCPNCRTVVSTAFADKLGHPAWIGTPEGAPPFIHPIVYFILSAWMNIRSTGSDSLLDVILDPDKELPDDLKDVIERQGFSYFYENFDRIFTFFATKHKKISGKSNTHLVRAFIETHRDVVFCKTLPILHKDLHPLTQSDSRKYADSSSTEILNAATNLLVAGFSVNKSIVGNKTKYMDKMLIGAYRQYIAYVEAIIKTKLGDKSAIIRHHLLGSRLHWSFRGVIIPITAPHEGDEIYLPWKIALSLYKYEILNLMVNRHGMDFMTAELRRTVALQTYDPLIDDILKTLIKESLRNGLAIILGRNPTLELGSIQYLRVTRIKTDPHDETICLSPLIIKPPNADFDGDELYGLSIKEDDMVNHLQTIHPMMAMLSKNRPELDTKIMITDQSLVCLNRFLADDPTTEV